MRTIVRLGPSFVKIAQVFAARADLMPEPCLAELGTLVDQVPPMPFEQVERTDWRRSSDLEPVGGKQRVALVVAYRI